MGALPEKAAALRAEGKRPGVLKDERRDQVPRFFLGQGLQPPVAVKAPGEGPDLVLEIECRENLDNLLVPFFARDPKGCNRFGPPKKPGVPREEGPSFPPGDVEELIVSGLGRILDVEAEGPKPTGQLAQHAIDDETHDAAPAVVLKAQKLHGQSRNENHGPGKGVGISLEAAEADETHPPGSERDDGQHGQDGRQPEGRGHQNDTAGVVPGGRIHDERYQRLTRPEDENRKEDPGRDIGLARALMDMDVASVVRVGMDVSPGWIMGMGVRMRLVPQGPVQSPNEVGQPKTDEKPSRQAPPEGLYPLELGHRKPQADTQEAEDNRA